MARARDAFPAWARRTVADRADLLGELAHPIVQELDPVVDAIIRSTGKGQVEALSSEVLATLDILYYYRKQATAILAPQRRASSTVHMGGVVVLNAPASWPAEVGTGHGGQRRSGEAVGKRGRTRS